MTGKATFFKRKINSYLKVFEFILRFFEICPYQIFAGEKGFFENITEC